jgi:DNA modification methylase
LDRTALTDLLAGEAARMVMTDPPYNVPINGFVGGKGKIKHREFAVAAGEMSDDEFIAFLKGYFEAVIAALVDGALLFVWMDWRHVDALIAAGKATGLCLINICV